MLYMRRTSKLEELLESLFTLFICTVWPGKETPEMKGRTRPHSLGRLDNVYSINGQNSESMNGKKGERDGESERGSGAGSGVSVWQDLLLISESFIHRLVINSPLNTSFSSPLRPRRFVVVFWRHFTTRRVNRSCTRLSSCSQSTRWDRTQYTLTRGKRIHLA